MKDLPPLVLPGFAKERQRRSHVRYMKMESEQNHNDVTYILEQADVAALKGDFRSVVKLYKRLDALGIPIITARIGEFFECGAIGLEKDLGEAKMWYQKAVSDSDDPIAHLGLGRIYFVGSGGTPKDLAQSREHLQKAFANNLPQAGIHLGIMSMFGEGAEKNADEAERFFLAAANARFPIAYLYLSDLAAASGRILKAIEMRIRFLMLTFILTFQDKDHPNLWSLPKKEIDGDQNINK